MKSFKKVDDLIFDITKQIYKRHDNNFLLILQKWDWLVGINFKKKSFPKKINKYNALIVQVEGDIFLDFQYNTEIILKKINALLESSTICKIKLILKN